MKRLIIAAVLFLPLAASGAEMKSLEDILSAERSPAMISYSLKRCSAAYIALSALMMADGGDQGLSDQASHMSSTFFAAASKYSEMNHLSFDAEGVTDLIGQMSSMYGDEMMANMAATGNRIDGVVKLDIAFCRQIYDSWQ